jgi:ABC-type sugar transport system ATPase subunit
MASVSFRHLTKIFTPPTPVLDDLSLEIRDGEFVAVLGPSGCGKSTILRCLAGLEPPTSGELLIGDRLVNDVAPADRDVAMVFQSYALYPHLNVGQNLEFPLRMRNLAGEERSRRVQAVAQRLGLGALLTRMPAELSGGQRQRVALGRALVREPAVFLFDEPLSNLDAGLRVQLRAEIMALHASLGATMLFVTHDQAEALTMGQRLVVLKGGRVQQVGTPSEVYQRPDNIFVAKFVGTPGMNVLEGAWDEGNEGAWFSASGFSSPLPCLTVPPSRAAAVGFRPEHLRLTDPGSGLATGTVEVVERLGSETLVHVSLSAQSTVVARLPGLAGYHPGDRVGVAPDLDQLHWFGPDGRRVPPVSGER